MLDVQVSGFDIFVEEIDVHYNVIVQVFTGLKKELLSWFLRASRAQSMLINPVFVFEESVFEETGRIFHVPGVFVSIMTSFHGGITSQALDGCVVSLGKALALLGCTNCGTNSIGTYHCRL